MQKARFDGVYELPGKPKIFTKNMVEGVSVYGERLYKDGGIEYREWDPKRSKLGASILKGVSQTGLREDYTVLYLGSSTGTTVSHVSDIVGVKGFVFALDFAPRVLRDLVFLCEQRKNVCPILSDANQPSKYMHQVQLVDFLFQDIAQKNQLEIFMKNLDLFLKDGAFGFLAIKARSVDVGKRPQVIYQEVRAELEKKVIIVDFKVLDPYEKDHCCFVVKKK
ncbi:MAG: fibrillarin-like rRNA/tRNA 2'-O-methyltransferase [archaeon]